MLATFVLKGCIPKSKSGLVDKEQQTIANCVFPLVTPHVIPHALPSSADIKKFLGDSAKAKGLKTWNRNNWGSEDDKLEKLSKLSQ